MHVYHLSEVVKKLSDHGQTVLHSADDIVITWVLDAALFKRLL